MANELHPADPFAHDTYIGGGCFRNVYRSKHWPSSRVVKVAQGSCDTDFNWNEWKLWQNAPKHIRILLAPCYAISDDGKFLLMRRTAPATLPELWNFRVPDALNNDLHRMNLGKVRGKVVIHDYGGWDRKSDDEMKKLLELLTAATQGEYSRPRAINITDAERRQYGLA